MGPSACPPLDRDEPTDRDLRGALASSRRRDPMSYFTEADRRRTRVRSGGSPEKSDGPAQVGAGRAVSPHESGRNGREFVGMAGGVTARTRVGSLVMAMEGEAGG